MERLSNILASLSHLNLEGKIVEKQPHASGLGGSCDVYTAWSVEHDKKVAVKQIRTFLKKDPSFAKKLAKEILIWSKLKQENILPFFGYFVEGNEVMPSLVSEWMEKGTLRDYMRSFPRGGILTCAMLRDIAAGLSYLHSKEVIHGDLKTQNILISASDIPLLSDFGLSVALSHSQSTKGTTTASTKGTVRWMAKELLLSVSGDEPSTHCERTDMWAFGMVIYELLSWEVPYKNIHNDVLVLMAIMNGQLPLKPNKSIPDGISFDILWTFACACWKQSIDRPPAEFFVKFLTTHIVTSRLVPGYYRVLVSHKTPNDTHVCEAQLVRDDFIFLCEPGIAHRVIQSVILRYIPELCSYQSISSPFEFEIVQSRPDGDSGPICRKFLVEDAERAAEWVSWFKTSPNLIVNMEDETRRLISVESQSGCDQDQDSAISGGVDPPDIICRNPNCENFIARAKRTSSESQSNDGDPPANATRSKKSSKSGKYRGKKRRRRAGA